MSRNASRPAPNAAQLINEAIRLFQSGDLRGAEKRCKAFMKMSPNHPEGFHLLGLIAFQQGKLTKAADLTGKAVSAGSKNPVHFANHALSLKSAGKLEEAAGAYESAVAMDPQNGGAWNDRGNVLLSLGRLADAEKSYRTAIECQPSDSKAHMNLGNLLLGQGRNDEALKCCRDAVRLSPGLAMAHNALGNALKAVGDTDAATGAFEKALERDAECMDALSNLASLYEETNQIEKARTTAENVLEKQSGHPHAILILAKCDRREARHEEALIRLEDLDQKELPSTLRRDIAFEQSRLYDRLNRTEEAFAAMKAGNAQALAAEGVTENLGDRFLNTVAGLNKWMTPETAAALNKTQPIEDGRSDPVFLVGFPRSGTTLLGQVLDSHSGLVMVEERPMLDYLVSHIRHDLGGYPDGVLSLDDEQRMDLRQRYFEAVDNECECSAHQRVVDKFPLHLIHAGLIRTVFPKAQFILALRHPCDVVLSCFMQNFRPNPAMANFFSVERGARTYDRVMDLWTAYEKRLKPDAHPVRYENVVAAFDTEIGVLLDFLRLEWEDGVRDFAERARSRGKIDTPSYAQVTENLYTRARYRWRRYEEQMQPAMADLASWIEHFGYGENNA